MAEWKVRRGDAEFTAANDDMVRQWAKEGRVQPTDYLFNPVLQRWMYAREVGEIAGVFQSATHASNKKTGCYVGTLGLLLCLLFWPLGIIVAAGGLIMYGIAEHKESSGV